MNRDLWRKAVEFHGHECPGLAIGVKACEAAILKMNIKMSEDEEIVCVTENDACGVDAIQAILGCSIGKGNLIYRDTAKQAFSFFNRANGDKLRVYLKVRNSDKNMERDEFQEYLLNADIDEIFDFSIPKYNLPEKARIFKSIKCEICGELAAEHKIRFQNGKKVCLDCFDDYSRGFKKY